MYGGVSVVQAFEHYASPYYSLQLTFWQGSTDPVEYSIKLTKGRDEGQGKRSGTVLNSLTFQPF